MVSCTRDRIGTGHGVALPTLPAQERERPSRRAAMHACYRLEPPRSISSVLCSASNRLTAPRRFLTPCAERGRRDRPCPREVGPWVGVIPSGARSPRWSAWPTTFDWRACEDAASVFGRVAAERTRGEARLMAARTIFTLAAHVARQLTKAQIASEAYRSGGTDLDAWFLWSTQWKVEHWRPGKQSVSDPYKISMTSLLVLGTDGTLYHLEAEKKWESGLIHYPTTHRFREARWFWLESTRAPLTSIADIDYLWDFWQSRPKQEITQKEQSCVTKLYPPNVASYRNGEDMLRKLLYRCLKRIEQDANKTPTPSPGAASTPRTPPIPPPPTAAVAPAHLPTRSGRAGAGRAAPPSPLGVSMPTGTVKPVRSERGVRIRGPRLLGVTRDDDCWRHSASGCWGIEKPGCWAGLDALRGCRPAAAIRRRPR